MCFPSALPSARYVPDRTNLLFSISHVPESMVRGWMRRHRRCRSIHRRIHRREHPKASQFESYALWQSYRTAAWATSSTSRAPYALDQIYLLFRLTVVR